MGAPASARRCPQYKERVEVFSVLNPWVSAIRAVIRHVAEAASSAGNGITLTRSNPESAT